MEAAVLERDQAQWNVWGQVEKFSKKQIIEAKNDLLIPKLEFADGDTLKSLGLDFDIIEFEKNGLLNEGINRLSLLITGTTTNPYNNANARLGVGNSTTAFAATHTDLQGASKLYKAMDATYPTVAGGPPVVMTFRSSFTDAEANFAWEEWSVDNGATPLENLNRRVVALGTKASGTWTLTVTIGIA